MPQAFQKRGIRVGVSAARAASHEVSPSAVHLPPSSYPIESLSPGRPSDRWSGAWDRNTWRGPNGIRLLLTLAVLCLFSYLGIALSRQSEGVATIWLTNGMLLGFILTRPRREWLGYFLAGLVADTAADMLYGDPFRIAIGVSGANSIEVTTSAVVLSSWFGLPVDLSKRRPLIGFLLVSVVGAAALTSALGALWTLLFVNAGDFLTLFRTWYLGDMLGMAIFAPLVFMLQRPGFFTMLRPAHLPRTLAMLAIPTVTGLLVFTHEADPLAFFIFPALLLVIFRLGFPGTVLTIFIIAFEAVSLTISGHGPLMLIPGQHMLLHRIVIAQIFLAVALFTSFPVAALLEERTALQHSLEESEAQYRRLANCDELTGLANRRAFNVTLEQSWADAKVLRQPLALILLDADLFKSYNDIYGHVGGDECLRCIARSITDAIESTAGFASRFGGEEFAVISPGTSLESALELAEKIRASVAAMRLPHRGCELGVQTISAGAACRVPNAGEPVMELVALADRALYRAKDLGRNRVIALGMPDAGELLPSSP